MYAMDRDLDLLRRMTHAERRCLPRIASGLHQALPKSVPLKTALSALIDVAADTCALTEQDLDYWCGILRDRHARAVQDARGRGRLPPPNPSVYEGHPTPGEAVLLVEVTTRLCDVLSEQRVSVAPVLYALACSAADLCATEGGDIDHLVRAARERHAAVTLAKEQGVPLIPATKQGES